MKNKNLSNLITHLIYQIFFQAVNINVFYFTDMFSYLGSNVQEIALKNNSSSSLFNINNVKYFSKYLQNYLFANFYYKNELDNNLLSNNTTQMSLIIDNSNYIKEKTVKNTIEDWSIFYFLTLLDKIKEKIFLKHLIFNKNYLLTFKWLSFAHNIYIFNSKM